MRPATLVLLAALAAAAAPPAAAWSLTGRAPTPRAARLIAGVSGAELEAQVSFKKEREENGAGKTIDRSPGCKPSPPFSSLQIKHLATFSSDPAPAVTRVIFTPADMAARAYVTQLMRDAGLAVRSDAAGNIVGRWNGTNPERGTVGTGSHIDAIPLAGAYDGTLGVLGPIAAVKALRGAGFEPQRNIDIFVTTSEEPTRYGVSCLGARLLAGALPAKTLAALVDANGTSFLEAATAAGYGAPSAAAAVASSRLRPAALSHWVELHIEQASDLEAKKAPVGVVSAIAALAPLVIRLTGPGGHAGTVAMADRADPLVAASEVILAAREAAAGTGARDTVATVGALSVEPGAENSVPRAVTFTVDIRDVDADRRAAVVTTVKRAVAAAAARWRVTASVDAPPADKPVTCDPDVVEAARKAAADAGMPPLPDVVSRAYHDSLIMAPFTRAGMIFVRCRGGVSHRPDEYASPADMAAGVRVLALTLADLAGGRLPEDPPPPIARRCPVSGVVSSGEAFRCPVMLGRKKAKAVKAEL